MVTQYKNGDIAPMPNDQTVFVVDDDQLARESVCAFVESIGIPSESFPSAEDFLEARVQHRAGCLVTDVHMPGMGGLELQERLIRQNTLLPIIVLTARIDVALTVRAIQNGAVTVLEKTCQSDELMDAIRTALAQDANLRRKHEQHQEIGRRIERLTLQERDVMHSMIAGKTNRAIAQQLDIGLRTVELRRQRVFSKMGTNSLADLVRTTVQVMPECGMMAHGN